MISYRSYCERIILVHIKIIKSQREMPVSICTRSSQAEFALAINWIKCFQPNLKFEICLNTLLLKFIKLTSQYANRKTYWFGICSSNWKEEMHIDHIDNYAQPWYVKYGVWLKSKFNFTENYWKSLKFTEYGFFISKILVIICGLIIVPHQEAKKKEDKSYEIVRYLSVI